MTAYRPNLPPLRRSKARTRSAERRRGHDHGLSRPGARALDTERNLDSMDTQTPRGQMDRRDGWRTRYLWDRLYPNIDDFAVALNLRMALAPDSRLAPKRRRQCQRSTGFIFRSDE